METKKPRTKEEIEREYANVCAEAGQAQYRAIKFSEVATTLFKRVDELQEELKGLGK